MRDGSGSLQRAPTTTQQQQQQQRCAQQQEQQLQHQINDWDETGSVQTLEDDGVHLLASSRRRRRPIDLRPLDVAAATAAATTSPARRRSRTARRVSRRTSTTTRRRRQRQQRQEVVMGSLNQYINANSNQHSTSRLSSIVDEIVNDYDNSNDTTRTTTTTTTTTTRRIAEEETVTILQLQFPDEEIDATTITEASSQLQTQQAIANPANQSNRERRSSQQNPRLLSEHFRRSYCVRTAPTTTPASISDASLDGTTSSSSSSSLDTSQSTSDDNNTIALGLSSSSRGRSSIESSCTSSAASRTSGAKKKKKSRNPQRKPQQRNRPSKEEGGEEEMVAANKAAAAAAAVTLHLKKVLMDQARSSIECPICLECYNESAGRVPCTLRCGHSFCHGHLTKIEKCPICRIALPRNPRKTIKKSIVLCEAAKAINEMVDTIQQL